MVIHLSEIGIYKCNVSPGGSIMVGPEVRHFGFWWVLDHSTWTFLLESTINWFYNFNPKIIDIIDIEIELRDCVSNWQIKEKASDLHNTWGEICECLITGQNVQESQKCDSWQVWHHLFRRYLDFSKNGFLWKSQNLPNFFTMFLSFN